MLAACGDKLKVHIQQAITKLTHNGQNWQLYNKENQLVTESKTVIIANAAAASQLNVGQDFSVSPLPGQLSLVAANAKSQYLKIPLSYEGHITPVRQGLHLIGSTYRHGREQDLSESKHDHQRVASYLDNIAPQLALDFSHAKAWLGSRSVTPDHLPLVGAVADKLEFDAMYQKIAKGSNRISFAKASYLPNLYISVGHGSKGLSSSLLSAEVIACLIEGSSLPISAKVYQAIHPSRFWLRQLKRGQAK
jgi:tRNA 5-methylaminomethyl-2-thiouridine biosynthesis bifunctional protein